MLKGGYTLWESKAGATPDIILIGTGSELSLAFEAGQIAGEGRQGRACRLASLLGTFQHATSGVPGQRARSGGHPSRGGGSRSGTRLAKVYRSSGQVRWRRNLRRVGSLRAAKKRIRTYDRTCVRGRKESIPINLCASTSCSSRWHWTNLHAAPLPSLYDYKVHSLDGKPVNLAKYKGRVALVVNVASQCGNTPQYAGLEKLYTEDKEKGFVILGFPSNDFGGQEPGTAAEITTFCTTKYHVTFPMFAKVDVKGDTQAPVYQFLADGRPVPTWNFSKYLVGKDGKVIQFFPDHVKPDDSTLTSAIDAALAAK